MLSIIVAVAENNAIGIDNAMPWHLPEDLKYFKKITDGKTIIMGRKTFQSLPGILPGRKHIVLSSGGNFHVAGPSVEIRHDAQALLSEYRDSAGESFIIGGAAIYKMALPYCYKLYITRVLKSFEADTFFPDFDEKDYPLSSRSQVFTDSGTGIKYRFDVYCRKQPF